MLIYIGEVFLVKMSSIFYHSDVILLALATLGDATQTETIQFAGNTKGGSIIVLLTSCLTGLESAV